MTTLALPDPQTATLARVPEIVAQCAAIREQVEREGDTATAEELRRRIDALATYLSDRDAQAALEAESRRTEVLIGKLLGPAEHGGDRSNGASSNLEFAVPANRRHDFRRMAENEALTERLISEGIVKRAAILKAISGTPEPEHVLCPTCGHRLRKDKPRPPGGTE